MGKEKNKQIVFEPEEVKAGLIFYPGGKVQYEDTVEVVLDGGNHAGFGVYGIQDGDGKATISGEEQIRQTVDVIAETVLGSR